MTSDAVVNDLSTLRVWFVLGSLHLLHQDLDQVDGFSAQYASEVLHHKWYQLVTSKNIAIVMPVLVFFAGGWRSTRYTEDAVKIIESLGVAEHLALKMWTSLGSFSELILRLSSFTAKYCERMRCEQNKI